jgi:hypothetical protein
MNINNLIPSDVTAAVAEAGLDKVAAAMNGVPVFDAPTAAGILGARAYLRRKEARSIADGIAAYAVLTGESGNHELTQKLAKIVTGR